MAVKIKDEERCGVLGGLVPEGEQQHMDCRQVEDVAVMKCAPSQDATTGGDGVTPLSSGQLCTSGFTVKETQRDKGKSLLNGKKDAASSRQVHVTAKSTASGTSPTQSLSLFRVHTSQPCFPRFGVVRRLGSALPQHSP